MTKPRTFACLSCGSRLHHELQVQHILSLKPIEFPLLCETCQAQWQHLDDTHLLCWGCSRYLHETDDIYEQPHRRDDLTYCFDCIRWLERYDARFIHHQSIYQYNEAFREWLYRYKFQADFRQGWLVSEALASSYQQQQAYQWLVLASSPASMQMRGFHATSLLLDMADIPHQSPFTYIGDNQKQSSKTRQARLQLKQAFAIDDTASLVDRPYLIFDDVYTTGATMLLAKQILFDALKARFPESEPVIESISLGRDTD